VIIRGKLLLLLLLLLLKTINEIQMQWIVLTCRLSSCTNT